MSTCFTRCRAASRERWSVAKGSEPKMTRCRVRMSANLTAKASPAAAISVSRRNIAERRTEAWAARYATRNAAAGVFSKRRNTRMRWTAEARGEVGGIGEGGDEIGHRVEGEDEIGEGGAEHRLDPARRHGIAGAVEGGDRLLEEGDDAERPLRLAPEAAPDGPLVRGEGV